MIPIFKPYIYKESKKLVNKSLKENNIANGPFISLFETEFSKSCDREYGVTCCNGTIALYLAIKSLNLPKNSEVILPSMSIVSCLTAITQNNLTPVFCDIDPITYNIDFSSLKEKITSKTSAVIIINTYGLMIDTDKLTHFKNTFPHIKIIEDASESHGATHKNIKAGSLGDISVFSFYANKIVTMGEGGIILTDDPIIYNNLLQFRNLNFIDRKKYIHSEAGFNFRLTNIQCALGLGQFKNIDKTIKHRKRVAYAYNKEFKLNPTIQIPFEDKDYNNVYWYYGILINKNYNKILKALEQNNVEYRHFFYPLHKQPFINLEEKIKNSEDSFAKGILLPTFNTLTSTQIKFISNIINSYK